MEKQQSLKVANEVTQDLFRLARHYGKEHRHAFEDICHDLAVMMDTGVLNSVHLRFLEKHNRIIKLEYTYDFREGPPRLVADGTMMLAPLKQQPGEEIDLSIGLELNSSHPFPSSSFRLNWTNSPTPLREPGVDIPRADGSTVHVGYSNRAEGVVKSYNPKSQYGFITNGEVDVFFHAGFVAPDTQLQPGDMVTYTPFITPRGLQAHYVMPIKSDEEPKEPDEKGLLAAIAALYQKIAERIQPNQGGQEL